MSRKAAVGLSLDTGLGGGMPIQRVVERLIACGYGLTYDGIVRGFRPYEALLDDIARLTATLGAGRPLKVLDVSCGVGTVAMRLARDGHTVVGLDAVEHLVAVARNKAAAAGGRVSFHAIDVANGPVPGMGTYDVLVSMHTLYWHPDPDAVLDACRRALRPGGVGLFLTYARPAHVVRTFLDVRAADGMLAAARALRWLVPTALFETFRNCEHRYLTELEFHRSLARAGFAVLEARRTFLAELSLLAVARVAGGPTSVADALAGT
jgi:SAM-dependent methyltransferase